MAKIGELVAEIKLKTEDAVKNADSFKKVLSESKNSLRDLDEIQRKTTKTSENYEAQMGIVNTTLEKLRKEYSEIGRELSTYEETTKQANIEAGKSEELTKSQERELQKLARQYSDLSKGIQNMEVRSVSLNRANSELINTTEQQARKEQELETQRESDSKKQEERIRRENQLRDEQIELDRQRETRQTEQYTREIQDRRLDARQTQVDYISGVGQNLERGSDAVTTGIGMVFEEFMGYEQIEAGILRLSKGDEAQNEELKGSIKSLMTENHEDNQLISDAIESVITSVSPDKYGAVLQGAVQNVLDLSLATGLSSEESASAILAVVRATGSNIEQAPNLFSGFNAIENVKEGVNTGHAVGTATTAAVPLLNAGLSWDEIVALTTMNSIQSQKGSGSDATSYIALVDTISRYNDKTEVGSDFLDSMGLSVEAFLEIGEGAVMASKTVKDYLKENNISKADVVKSIDDMQLNLDLQDALGVSSSEDVDKWMQQNGLLEGLVKLSQYFNTLVTDDKSYAAVVAEREYLSGNTNSNISMQNLSTFSDSEEFTQLSKEGNAMGSSLKDEADTMRETSANQIKEFYKRLQFDLIEIGGELAPVLMDMLPGLEGLKDTIIGMVKAIASLPPGVLETLVKANLGVKVGGMALGGAGTLFGGVAQFRQFQVANKVLASTKGAVPAINALNAGSSVIGGVDGLSDALTHLNTTSGVATSGVGSIGSGLVGVFGVGGTVLLALAATAAVAAGFLAIEHQANEASKRQKGWQREGAEGISQDVRDGVYEVTAQSKGINYSINNALSGGDIEIGDLDLTGFNDTANIMVEKISETVKERLDAFSDLEELGIDVTDSRIELTSIQTRATEIQTKMSELLSQIVESNGKHTEEQLQGLKDYQTELDKIYAEAFAETADQQRSIREELERSRMGENLSYGDKKSRIGEINDEITKEDSNFERNKIEIQNRRTALESGYKSGEINQVDYAYESAKYIDALETLETQREDATKTLLAEANYLRNTMSVFESGKFMFTEESKLLNDRTPMETGAWESGYAQISRNNTQTGDVYGAIEDLKIRYTDGMDEAQLELVERYNGVLKEIQSSSERLTQDDVESMAILTALDFMGDEGVESLVNLKTHLGEALPPTFLADAKEQTANYLATLSEAELATEQGLQLQVYSNSTEVVDEFFTLHGLWNNTEFMTQWLDTDLNDEDARAKLGALVGELTNLESKDFNLWVTDNIDGITTKTKNLIEWVKAIPKNITMTVKQNIGKLFNRYADGTNFHNGGPAWLGDGYEPEFVKEPNGKAWVTPNQPFLYDLPRGSVVIPQHDWRNKKIPGMGYPKYADGVGSVVSGDTTESTNFNVTVNAYTNNVDIPLVKREIEKSMREIELNQRRIRTSGGES